MKLKQLLFGMSTFLPGVDHERRITHGGTASARYCYSVWLRHLVHAHEHGLDTDPTTVAELGPGNTLGMGIAALLTGAERCFALDVVEHANTENNVAVFADLVELFRTRADIPDANEFPEVKPYLDDYSFPREILTDVRLERSLDPERVARIEAALRADEMIEYKVPWFDADVIEEGCVDMIFSQAVLEHVQDLQNTYASMQRWLKPDGFISHQIDFRCHGTADEWNGHWRYSDLIWRLYRGRQPFLINRHPHSTHLETLEKHGFDVCTDQTVRKESPFTQQQLARRFQRMSDDDLVTSGAFIQARKG